MSKWFKKWEMLSVNQFLVFACALFMAGAAVVFSSPSSGLDGLEFFSHANPGEALRLSWRRVDGLLTADQVWSAKDVGVGESRAGEKIDTKLSESWHVFSFEPSKDGVAFLTSRHALAIQCKSLLGSEWSAGMVDRLVNGRMRALAQGYAFDVKSGDRIECAQKSTGPAKIGVRLLDAAEPSIAQKAHDQRQAMILAAFGMLVLYSLISSVINRDATHAIFTLFLFANMRLAQMSIGADVSMLGWVFDAQWMPRMRMLTISAAMGALMILHERLVGPAKILTQAKWLALWEKATTLGVMALMVLSFGAPFKFYLPFMWVCLLNVGLFLLAKSAMLAPVGSQWRQLSRWGMFFTSFGLSMPIYAGLSEMLAAAVGYVQFVDYFNHESGAMLASLFATLAFANQLREQRAQAELAKKALKQAYDTSPMGLFEAQLDGTVVQSNGALLDMLGESAPRGWSFFGHLDSEIWDRVVDSAVLSGGPEAIDAIFPAKATNGVGQWFDTKVKINEAGRIEGSLHDATERVLHKQRLEFLASHDPLTECLNLRGLEEALDAMDQSGGDAIVAYFDLDRFKLINDVYGHEAGDSVLRQVHDRLQSALGDGVDLGRVGGDEFLALFHDMGMDSAQKRCEAALESIGSQAFTFGGKAFKLSVSAGLVEAAAVGATHSRALIGAADSACRMAKNEGRDKLVAHGRGSMFFERRGESLEIAKLFDNGATPNGLYLLAQPIMSLRSPFESLNFEVLMRMRMADGRLIGAPSLIETAEAHGCVARLDLWMLETILNWIGDHKAELAQTRFICVNFSGASLNDEAFLAKAFSLMESKRWQAEMLCVEITESVALRDLENIRSFITRARALGVRVALDDFGAGYSSFGYLKDLPADALKVDGALVRDAMANPASQSILVSLSGLSSALGMRSIGEWAENAEMVKMLALAGFDYAQGYAIAKPMAMDELIKAKSCADLIEDPVVMSQVRLLQSGAMMDALAEVESKYLH